ncbi:hypothetical protein SAMN05216387_103277 [Nitrosovibrio tenuis]|uniref:Uncharacterized protein n=1 Tax=Nitrosovibrio tenuis TaxID=1233 RepID=A0A1H7KN13_9PROT|nr:hypothetical protein SAMN05216387_103277 [Nitrosovibrio tenuis]
MAGGTILLAVLSLASSLPLPVNLHHERGLSGTGSPCAAELRAQFQAPFQIRDAHNPATRPIPGRSGTGMMAVIQLIQ